MSLWRILPPKWMVKIMEKPMNKWMIWVVFPLFLEGHPYPSLKLTWLSTWKWMVVMLSRFLLGFRPIFRCELLVSGRVVQYIYVGSCLNTGKPVEFSKVNRSPINLHNLHKNEDIIYPLWTRVLATPHIYVYTIHFKKNVCLCNY